MQINAGGVLTLENLRLYSSVDSRTSYGQRGSIDPRSRRRLGQEQSAGTPGVLRQVAAHFRLVSCPAFMPELAP